MNDTTKIARRIAPHFDKTFYCKTYPDCLAEGGTEVEHYVRSGAARGYDPAPDFSTRFYLETYPDVAEAGVNPFWHYIVSGRAEGRLPRPDLTAEMQALFDGDFYLERNPDVAAAGVDPFTHFCQRGWKEGRDPVVWFSVSFYERTHALNKRQNPLEHYVQEGRQAALKTHPYLQRDGHCVQDDIRLFSNASQDAHEVRDPFIATGRLPRARALALYLPQFHPIAENDLWWGKGFTEWRNVGRGTPRFKGHYQPRIPEELGHYDLRDGSVMARQVQMAREAGIEGFCFYYYWFNGKRVLEKPLNDFLDNTDLDCSFAILWANENWTRRWDGLERDVLLEQNYRAEDDEAFVDDLCRHFRDPRYIRVKGRPLFIIYRPGLIPDTANTIARWRALMKARHGISPWIFMSQGFGDIDPRPYGLDGAMEFPPHKVAQDLPSIISQLEITDLRFTGNVSSYDALVANAAMTKPAPYPLMRGVAPSWDNDARRQGNGSTYHGSTPAKYEAWLNEAADYASTHPFEGESIVFINAWNEWAEAAYLEPDVHYGAAYLNATARALTRGKVDVGKAKVVLVTHDAHPHGAQLLVKNMARMLTRRFGVEVAIVALGDGPLLEDYRQIAPTHAVGRSEAALEALLPRLRREGFASAIVNTTVSGWCLPALRKQGFFTLSLVHELPRLIAEYGLEPEVRQIARHAHLVVFPAPQVQKAFVELAGGIDPDKCVLRPQGSYLLWNSDPAAALALRDRLGLAADDKLVINVGYADARKGFDIFVGAAKRIVSSRKDVHFAWIGGADENYAARVLAEIAPETPAARQIHVLPFTRNPVPCYEAADLFFLSSREDPFPTVVLEALKAGLPVVGLEDSGGSVDVIRATGALASRDDLPAIASAITGLLDQPVETRTDAARERKGLIDRRYRFECYLADLLAILNPGLPRISAIVPNYRYATYLPARLDSIARQTCPVYETLVLDDASPDDSLAVLEQYRRRTGREFDLVVNPKNTGSGYVQWACGARMARGDLVWIAEADDLAENEFLVRARKVLEDPEVAYVFCDSSQRDEGDRLLGRSYGFYYDTVEPGALRTDTVMEGGDFVRRFLSVKNVILNVSAVVWRRDALLAALAATEADHMTMKVACDWKMYAHAALTGGKVGYVAQALNMHRRHSQSVTHSRDARAHYDEIVAVQDHIAKRVVLDAETRARREAYRQELRKQFKIDETVEGLEKENV